MVNEKKIDNSVLSDDVSIASSMFIAIEADHEVPLIPIKEENADLLDGARNLIGVPKSGHGFYAEVHHTATRNLNGFEAGSDVHATRFGSNELGSPDIGLDSGEQYNLKYYKTASETLKAAINKAEYAGQILVPPSDQLDDIQSLRAQWYEQAVERGDTDLAQRLDTLHVSSSVEGHDDIAGDALSYSEAQDGAHLVRDGGSPDFADPYGWDDLGEHSADAAGLALAANLLPDMANEIKAAWHGKKSISDVSKDFGNALRTHGLKVGGQSFVKSGLSGALAATDEIDPTGAVLIVTLTFEIGKHALALNSGEIDIVEFKRLASRTIFDKGGSILLTSGAVALLGPAGLITPIIVGKLVANARVRGQVSSALNSVFSEAESLVRNQLEILAASKISLAYAQDTNTVCRSTSTHAEKGTVAGENTIEALEGKQVKLENIRQRLISNKLNRDS